MSALAVVLAVMVALGLTWVIKEARSFGICPYPNDPRSYAQHGCETGYVEGATTLDGALKHYEVPMPVSATAVRFYLEPGAFDGGDAFYLKFSASAAQMRAFLAALGAQKTGHAVATSGDWSEPGDEVVIPWVFTTADTDYSFSRTIDVGSESLDLTGTVTVTAEMTTAYVTVQD